MAQRTAAKQSAHDDAVRAAGQIYRERGWHACLNPGGEKNTALAGLFVDIIASATANPDNPSVTEVETEDSVTEEEAESQWVKYGEAFPSWHLAVPVHRYEIARRLVAQHRVQHCRVIMWDRRPDGMHRFWGLPGLET